jgi:hypothetical protein
LRPSEKNFQNGVPVHSVTKVPLDVHIQSTHIVPMQSAHFNFTHPAMKLQSVSVRNTKVCC